MRLIDADKLKKDYLDLPNCYNGFSNTYDKAYIIGVLEEQPTIDAVERKRGRWIHDGYDIPHGVDWMHCSVCGRREPHVPAAMTDFCPSCGAEMLERRDDV